MPNSDTEVLMITYNRPEYTRLSLERLLDTADGTTRVWVWHNGTHEKTLKVVESFRGHSKLYRFYHSPENKKLTEPTNWLWRESTGAYLGKVDDDCLVPPGWIDTLRAAHEDVPDLGVVACWHFPEEDFDPSLSESRILRLDGRHRILQSRWVGGSGYLMKRRCVERHGFLRDNRNFTKYCLHLSDAGWVNGWYYPLICQEHMDDPRSPHTLLKTDADLEKYLPLSAQRTGVSTLQEWQAQLQRSARTVQSAPLDPGYGTGRRWSLKRIVRFLRKRTLR